MRFFTLTALLAAALFSAAVIVPFLSAAKNRPDFFTLEARITSTSPGWFQVYLDDGAGIREALSARVPVPATAEPLPLRLAIPSGTYRALRIDPLDHSGTITLSGLQVRSSTGRVVRQLALTQLKPTQQIETLAVHGDALQIVIKPGADDPQLEFIASPALSVRFTWRDLTRGALPRFLPLFAGLALILFAIDRSATLRHRFVSLAVALPARPRVGITLVAGIAVIASAYPVVFLGKSYVSPNVGTTLLYDTYPTLPGYTSNEVVDVKLSDVGAVMWQHVPFSMIQHRALAQGELPLWNRYNAGGVPLLAQGQSMFGDPLHLLVVAANGAAWAWDLKYLIAKWLFAVGLALTVLALVNAPRAGFGAALVVAFAAPFVGFFLYRLNHPAFFSLCYAPWPLLCLVQIAQATTRRAVGWWCLGLLVANLALMNSGTVKEAYMLLLCANFSGGCVLLATPMPWRTRLSKLGEVAWFALIFVLITAPIWATFLQTLKNAYTGYNAASAYQIQPTLLLGAFDEIFYRPLMSENRVFSPSLNFVLLLGLLYFLATLREQFAHRAVIALALSSLVPFALAFGLVPPTWIVTLPFLSNIAHLDNTFSCALIVLWSVLAGVGFATAARRLGTRDGRHDLIIAGLLLAALVFGWIAFRQAAHRPILGPTFSVHPPGQVLPVAGFIWDYLITLLVAAVALAVLVHLTFARRTLTAARALLLALCVSTLLWRHGLHARSAGFEDFTARPPDRVNFHAKSGAMEFARAEHAKEPGRGFGFHGNFFPGWTSAYGLETVHGPDALVNPWLRELVTVSGVERIWDWRLYVEPANAASAQPFLDALNVRFYFDLLTKDPVLAKSLSLVKSADLDVYESRTAWPRAFFTDRIEVYDNPPDLVAKFRSAAGAPFAAVQRSDRNSVTALERVRQSPRTNTATPATNYRLTENTTSFRVHANGPGAIVLTEVLWPGDFRAEVNGRKVPIIRMNHAFKAVLVDAAGDYTVTFRYWPRSFPRNLVLCAIGFVLLFASLVFALRRRPAAVA